MKEKYFYEVQSYCNHTSLFDTHVSENETPLEEKQHFLLLFSSDNHNLTHVKRSSVHVC